MHISELVTPALVVDGEALRNNIETMAKVLPGPRLRPHVKAHKCTALARLQMEAGHENFTCATIAEVEGMAEAGLTNDLLLANEVLDARRLASVDARVTVAVDSEETVQASADAGIKEVVIDVNVGLPRCGCDPDSAGKIADFARSKHLEVRGVMGYEGHIVGLVSRETRTQMISESMELLVKAHNEVGGDVISAGGTGTFDINIWATEIQAGSYVAMDNAYSKLDLPFEKAAYVLGTVISKSPAFAVIDCGLKAFGMDHGDPEMENGNQVWFVSDEHITFGYSEEIKVGDRLRVFPSHIDPTFAYHSKVHVVVKDEVVDVWPIDLRGW